MNDEQTDRLKKIIGIANKLHWVLPPIKNQSYPTMMLSEVEKCMIAMVDNFELERMENWINEPKKIIEET